MGSFDGFRQLNQDGTQGPPGNGSWNMTTGLKIRMIGRIRREDIGRACIKSLGGLSILDHIRRCDRRLSKSERIKQISMIGRTTSVVDGYTLIGSLGRICQRNINALHDRRPAQ
jgi:hypothetical protein